MKLLGFHQALFGDLAMSTVAARIVKKRYPGRMSHLTFVIGQHYAQFAPLLLNQPDIDRLYITHAPKDGYDEVDRAWIASEGFTHVFDPRQDHDHSDPWFKHRHQPLELAHMHGLPIEGESGKVVLTKWFKETEGLRDHVAFSPFPGFYAGIHNPKCLTMARAQAIVDHILSRGFKVLQVGHPDEPQLVGTTKLATDYFGSVKNVLGCRCMVMGDSGMSWCLSAYDFPVIGLYATYYHSAEHVHNIQPLNPNGHYLSAHQVNDIPLEAIYAALDPHLS